MLGVFVEQDETVIAGTQRFSSDGIGISECLLERLRQLRLQPANPLLYVSHRLPALVCRSEHKETKMPDDSKPASGFVFGLTNLKPVEPLEKIALTFPDGATREFPKNIAGVDIAKGISPSLAK